jgi:two-component system response regulator HydG
MLDVLVVDDDDIVRGSIAEAIAAAGHRVAQASDGEQALSLLQSRCFDLAVCDVQMPRLDGLTLFRRLRHDSPGTSVVLMTSFGKIPDAVGSLRGGAVDYVTKPFDPDEFAQSVVGPIAERLALRTQFEEARRRFVATEAGTDLVGTSLVMRQVVHRISVVANSDASVFITGDRGTGKKSIARTLHAQSPRRSGPFLVVPCASLTDLMIEAELRELSELRSRGYRDEWFRAAEGGTIVLDRVDVLPMRAQSNLLRVIDEPTVHARRDHEWQPRGVRIVSLSETPPADLLKGGGFVEALLFRLNAVPLRAPSLVEREGDLYLLVCHFLREFTPSRRRTPGLTPKAWKALSAYGFPGNVQELAWVVEHAVAASDGEEIDCQHLPEEITLTPAPSTTGDAETAI